MRINEIFSLLKENVLFALFLTIIVAIIFFVTIKLVNRNSYKHKISFTNKQFIAIALFTVYMLTVLGLTLLNRGSNFSDSVNLLLFSSYKEAWYNFSLRGWQLIYFNIMMFIPFGLLLPLLHNKLNTYRFVVFAAFLFTFLIESLQYATGFGIFELDDLFNNILGALIGYGIIKIVQLRQFNFKSLIHLLPLLIVIAFSTTMFTYYYAKDFGNLNIVPAYKHNMTNVTVSSNLSFNTDRQYATVYKAPLYNKEEAKQFAMSLFNTLNVSTSNIEIIAYQNDINYRYNGNPSYFIWVNLLNRAYTYTDFSFIDHSLADADKIQLEAQLKQFKIDIPEQAVFSQLDTGKYEWRVHSVTDHNELIDGVLSVEHYNDGTIKKINQAIISYEKVTDVQIISEQEAYNKLTAGHFKFYNIYNIKGINLINIKQVQLDYLLDSKGFYQPIYTFDVDIDGQESSIQIPAI